MKYLTPEEREKLAGYLHEIEGAPTDEIVEEYTKEIKEEHLIYQAPGTPVYVTIASTGPEDAHYYVELMMEDLDERSIYGLEMYWSALEDEMLDFPKVRACGVEALDWLGRFEEQVVEKAMELAQRFKRLLRWQFTSLVYELAVLKFYDLVFRAAAASEDRGVEICVGQLEDPTTGHRSEKIYLYAVLDPDRLFEPDYMDEVRRRYEALAYAAPPQDCLPWGEEKWLLDKHRFGDPYIPAEEFEKLRREIEELIAFACFNREEKYSAYFSHLTITRGVERYRLR